ncbi:MAG: RusA family crossover junction endodeoxyribonuclease [Planctomycetaceae bacterium]
MSLPHSPTDAVALLQLVLPFPPSVNRYYRHVGYRTLLSREGRQYRAAVCALLAGRVQQPLSGRLAVRLDLFPPDRRRRDWDNYHKALWDACQHAGVLDDDCQIKQGVVELHEPDGPPRAEVLFFPYLPDSGEPLRCPTTATTLNSTMTTTSIPSTTRPTATRRRHSGSRRRTTKTSSIRRTPPAK